MEYEWIRSRRKTMAAEIRGRRLIVRTPLRATRADVERFLQQHRKWIEAHLAKAPEASAPLLTPEELRALAEEARRVIPERVARYAPEIGVSYGRITIRSQRTRWGSCSGRGDLSFNCLLMLAPPEVVDSVVVHELCHRREMNHSPRFYAQVLRVFPDYEKWRRWLKENGPALLARLG